MELNSSVNGNKYLWTLKVESIFYHLPNFPLHYLGHKLTVLDVSCNIHTAFVYWFSPKIMQKNFSFPSFPSLLIYWLVGFWQVCTFCSEHFLDVSLMCTFKRRKNKRWKNEKSRREPKTQQAGGSMIVAYSLKDNHKWNLPGVLQLKL